MEIIAGNIANENDAVVNKIWEDILEKFNTSKSIMGYKTPSFGKSIDETPSIVIRSAEYGIILIDVVTEAIKEFDEQNEYWKTLDDRYIQSKDIIIDFFEKELMNRLKDDSVLYNIRKGEFNFEFKTHKILVFSQNTKGEIDVLNAKTEVPLYNDYVCIDNWDEYLKCLKNPANIDKEYIDIIDSIFDGSYIFNKKQKKIHRDENITMGLLIKESLQRTFKLDNTQRQVALQIPDGPQRIRGLAGTGKTIILCMKAALAHKFDPSMNILFVFNTQSMYNQVEDLIIKYYFNETQNLPDFSKLHILHAWGGSNKPGVYYNTAKSVNITPLNFMNVRSKEDPLDVIYSDLLNNHKEKITPKYDMVLIDEAQDFPPSFFETLFYLTKYSTNHQKRIVWAYDEFQSLTDIKIKEPVDLFGKDLEGNPNMPNSILDGEYKGSIKKDFVLPNSYRNPRITLMLAHGLALGLYTNTKVPMIYKNDWESRGYSVLSPQNARLNEGDLVRVTRPEEYSKNNLEKILEERGNVEKLIQLFSSEDNYDQLDKVIDKITWIINNQNVEPEEIIVIDLDTKSAKNNFQYIRQYLDQRNIKCITPGFIESNDSFKEKGFVTLATPFRAKGNETNVVFIINSNKIVNDKTFRLRNSIFVSITRSRGWCYIYTNNNEISFKGECDKIIADYPFFNFTVPSIESITRRYEILTSNKDLEKTEKQIDLILNNKDLEALLLEKLLSNPEFIAKIKDIKNED